MNLRNSNYEVTFEITFHKFPEQIKLYKAGQSVSIKLLKAQKNSNPSFCSFILKVQGGKN